MVKKVLIVAAVVLSALSMLYGGDAHAHELKTVGAISSLLHINPDDDPIAGQPSELLFLIKDKDKKFNAQQCNCQASVSYNNEVLFSSALAKAASSYRGIFAPAILYTFPHKGMFTVTLRGEPKTANDFQSFSISYDIRIEKDASTLKDTTRSRWDYVVAAAGLILICYFLRRVFINPSRHADANKPT